MSTNNADMMSPDVSPVQDDSVRSANNLPIYLGLTVAAIVLAIVAVVASDRSKAQIQNKLDETTAVVAGTTQFAVEITGNRLSGYIPAKEQPLDESDGDLQIAEVPGLLRQDANGKLYTEKTGSDATLFDSDLPPIPPVLNAANTLVPNVNILAPVDDEALRIQEQKMQALQSAITSGTTVQIKTRKSPSSTPAFQDSSSTQGRSSSSRRHDTLNEIQGLRKEASENGTDALMASLTQQISAATQSLPGSNRAPSNNGIASQNNIETSTKSGNEKRWQLDSQIEAPISDYIVRTGFVIPATLITGINSDLPGQIIAQVSQNVSDTGTGNSVLIPQGSKLIGSYMSNVAFNQRRVMVAWQRIVFPDGKALDIGSMPGADLEGYSGFNDQVNNHYLRIFGSALLMSGITASISLSQGDNDNGDDSSTSASQELSAAIGQQLGQVAVEMIRHNMSISPTLEIRPGFKLNVMVTKDISFYGPYKAFDY